MGLLATPAAAQDANGYTWATIDHAGNRATIASEVPIYPNLSVGAVDYEYRMATTEVSVGQWLEFVQAYAPTYIANGGNLNNPDFRGSSIILEFDGRARLRPGVSAGRPADMSWEFAARYVNWLHNGRSTDPAAFESGAYDTSTFTQNADGTYNHQATRSEGARFWIPSRDEWIKAMHYDPDRYGEGGYWMFPDGSNTDLLPGLLPEDGGERNAGPSFDVWPLDVGSFDHVRSTFGLLDGAGGVSEWTETLLADGSNQRFTDGTSYTANIIDDFFSDDRIEFSGSRTQSQSLPTVGLRIASVVPSSGSSIMLAGGLLITARRRR